MKKLSSQIKLFYLKVLYVFLDVLTDITDANPFFVKQKIYIGAAIIAVSVTINSCSSSGNHKVIKNDKKDSIKEITTMCYKAILAVKQDKDASIKTSVKKKQKIKFQVPEIKDAVDESVDKVDPHDVSTTCYIVVDLPEDLPRDAPGKLTNENDTLHFVEQMPRFPGGSEEMNRFISKTKKYPVEALEKGISGRVVLKFIVTKNGNITNLKVLRSVSPELDKEAIRIVSLMPNWTPGKQNGQNVNVQFTMPITFTLQE
jgi:TonB family protein